MVAQTIMAAGRTVEDRTVHSVQQVFLRPGQANVPLRYRVEQLFLGRTFASVRVEVWQQDHIISHAQVGLSGAVDTQENHADPMPEPVPRSAMVNRARHNGHDDWDDRPIEILISEDEDADDRPTMSAWLRAAGEVPDDPLIHRALLGYASDRMLLSVARKPYRGRGEIRAATLNHSIWFHRETDISQWHLQSLHSSTAGHARAMINGAFHREDGEFVASSAQEGMMRSRRA